MTGLTGRTMRGTDLETELRDVDVSAIALVGRPAIGVPYAIVKSEEVTAEEVVAPASGEASVADTVAAGATADEAAGSETVTTEEIKKLFAEQAEVIKAAFNAGPQIANDAPFSGATPDPQKEAVVKSLKDLVAASDEMPKPQRAALAVIAKYHGVEGPTIADDEEDGSSPAMQSLEKKLDAIVSAMGVMATKFQELTAPAPAPIVTDKAAKPVKKDDEALAAALADRADVFKALKLVEWQFLKATGKDPGPKPE
jgi:hypothetical protein